MTHRWQPWDFALGTIGRVPVGANPNLFVLESLLNSSRVRMVTSRIDFFRLPFVNGHAACTSQEARNYMQSRINAQLEKWIDRSSVSRRMYRARRMPVQVQRLLALKWTGKAWAELSGLA